MTADELKQLIKNLRRGDDMEESRLRFFNEINTNTAAWCSNLSLRWLISVADTYIDHGTPIEARNAIIISVYFNIIKIADTARLLTTPNCDMLPRLLEDVVFMYDEVNSLRITQDDMPNNLFFRIDELLKITPPLQLLFEEVKKRLDQHSQTLKITEYNKDFYKKEFFANRRNFKQTTK